jgi:hypothetical protein
MKPIIGLLLFFLFESAAAQNSDFFRVYDSRGKKVARGIIFTYSDTSLTLTRRNRFFEIPISQIDVIKSKRTTGHRIAMTTLTVAGVAFIVAGTLFILNNGGYRNGTLSPGPGRIRRNRDKPGNEKIKSPLEKIPKPQKKYKVNADAEKWKETRKALNYYII